MIGRGDSSAGGHPANGRRRYAAKLLSAIESGRWLTRRRLFFYSAILLAFELAAALFLTLGTYGVIVPLNHPTTTDFISFYAAGELADSGAAPDVYTQPEHFAAEQRASEPGISYVYFFYPPIFILLCAVFALFPYLVAFTVFESATLVACLILAKRITGEIGWKCCVPMLAFPAVFINVGVGQNGLLTAALFAGATLLVDSRPGLAGLLFGAVCYKPHYGILIPVALIAGRRWRSFAAATATAAALAALSLGLFGLDTWRGFLTAIAGSQTTYDTGKVDFAAFSNVFGALRLVGASPAVAYTAQGATLLAMAALVAYVWRRNLALPLRAATLIAAALTAAPLSLFYDLTLAGIAIAWLVRDGKENGFLKGEIAILTLVFVIPLPSRGLGTALHLPLAALGPIALVVLCVMLVRRRLAGRWTDLNDQNAILDGIGPWQQCSGLPDKTSM